MEISVHLCRMPRNTPATLSLATASLTTASLTTISLATISLATISLATILPMATNRLDLLKQMVAQDPKNSFARYGLAMEYANNEKLEDAVAEFKALLANDETYAAAYYHGGQALEKMGRLEEARGFYERGIDACDRKGDAHTRSEIEAALSSLPI